MSPRGRGGPPPGGRAPGGPRPRVDGDAPWPAAGRRGGEPGGGPGERAVYGAGPVRELLARRPRAILALWVEDRRADRAAGHDPVAALAVAARAAGIPVESRDRLALERAVGADARHQGVVAWLGAFAYAELDAMLDGPGPALLLALDGVEDPRNLGAILRSAYLLGVDGVLIPEHRAAAVTPLVGKASAGASELLPIARVGNLVRALAELKEAGLWACAVHADPAARPIAALDATVPLCLVLGAEGSGVRPLVARQCDFHAVIPMVREGVGSFNVSVAAALALYEVRRQRDGAAG